MNKKRFAPLLALCVLASSAWARPKVLIVSPEQTGILQTGGLAHATTGLAVSMNTLGVHADVLMPHYLNGGSPLARSTGETIAVDLDWRGGVAHKRSEFSVLLHHRPMNPTIFLRHETPEGQVNYFDNPKGYGPDPTLGESFGAFGKAAADYIISKDYDVVILSDWTTGLIAVHLHEARLRGIKAPKIVFAIHNIAYQGNFPYALAEFLGLSPQHFTMDGYEFYGQMSLLKAGMIYSDATYTVSQRYSQEIATPRFGAGLDGVVRFLQNQNRMFGFLNGIIESDWDPSRSEEGLKYNFDRLNLSGKAAGKADLQAQLGLPVDASKPIFILTSRLAEQKGFDYLIDAIDAAAALGDSQWAITGDGEPRFVEGFRELERRYPENVRYQPFSSSLEKLLTRYGDFAVNGAWFEPSGQNQFFAMKNGTIPLVSAVGGLVDSISPGQTGFMFEIVPGKNGEAFDREATAQNALQEFRHATQFYHQPLALRKMRLKVMGESHSWNSRVKANFLPFFGSLLGENFPEDCNADLLP